jgi:hypothetical protein
MIDPAQIPDEVVEAAAQKFCFVQGYIWDCNPDFHPIWRIYARAVIAAAINEWPCARSLMLFHEYAPHIVLPIPEGELESLGPEFEAAWDANVDRLYEFDKPEGEA